MKNILTNSKDEKIIKFKKIKEKKQNVKKEKKNRQNDKIYICKICGENLNVCIDHFKSKEHINNFNKNIEIRTKKSIDIIFKFKITTKDAFYNDLYFKKVAKQKVRENMIKDKKYKYSITLHNRILDNINNKLTDYKFGYTSEDIFNAIDTNFSDRNILNTYDVKDDDNNEETALIQKEIIKKDEERLMNNETISKQDKEKLLEENKKLMETIKKVEHAEIREWLLESGEIENENEITDKYIQEMRDNYFDFLYGNSNVVREYNENGTFDKSEIIPWMLWTARLPKLKEKNPPIQIVEHQTQQNIILN